MRTTHSVSILVAALVMLRHPCSRNKATARFLLERAAELSELTPAERDACRLLAEDLDNDPTELAAPRQTQSLSDCRMLGERMEMC